MRTEPLGIVSSILERRARHLHGIIERNRERFGQQWEIDFNEIVNAVFPTEEALIRATSGYSAFCNSAMRQQARLQKTRQYEFSTFQEAASRVYRDVEYMNSEYLPGLLLSHFLWPHHYAQLCFFRQTLHSVQPLTFAEIGVGTGVYSFITLKEVSKAVGSGIDISKSSLEFAESLFRNGGFASRYQEILCDISETKLSLRPNLVISVELLEHLETPTKLLQGIAELITDGGVAFVTAALNAAHTDHIYLYSEPTEVERQLHESGLIVRRRFFEEAYPRRSVNELVPAVVAYEVVSG